MVQFFGRIRLAGELRDHDEFSQLESSGDDLVIFLLDEENGVAGVGPGREGDANSFPLT
jgi:hypothetical protein